MSLSVAIEKELRLDDNRIKMSLMCPRTRSWNLVRVLRSGLPETIFVYKQTTVHKPLTCLPINSQIDFDISKGRLHKTQCSLKDSNFKYHSHMNLRGHI